ncbi:MAG: hypothetical protein QXJ93_01035 [Candidatus Rehaiarchaeum fermentans]|nr:hypothetical protein [Candidatus Rehaiarchaeum fermentans]
MTDIIEETKEQLQDNNIEEQTKKPRKRRIRIEKDKIKEDIQPSAFFDIQNMTDEECNILVTSFINMLYTAIFKIEPLSQSEIDGMKPHSRYILEKYANKFLARYYHEIGIAIVLAPGFIMRLQQKSKKREAQNDRQENTDKTDKEES